MLKLIIEDDEGRTTVVPLVRDELTIGRKEGNTIRLTERNVSRKHARLFRQNGAFAVEDFASYTGVRLNGVRIVGTHAVKDGDQVQIGDYKLSLRSEADGQPVTATSPGLQAPGTGGAGAPAAAPATAPAPVSAATAAPVSPPPAVVAASVSAPMDAAPTIPLRTLEEQGRVPKVATAQPARLVVVTSELAGTDFKLDRQSLVIGRTEENDIILNHASISRHHAKVVRDGDRYTIVDLQSANGVRVAGESYERVDVQPGDVIELGHVKLRFVGPWEDWTYNPREFAPRSRRKVKIGAAVGGVALAGVLILALRGKAPEPPPVVIAPPPGPTPAQLLADAKAAADKEDWEKAVTAIDMLLGHPGNDPAAMAAVKSDALELKRKVDLERRGAETYAAFQQAAAAKEPDVALSHFDELPPDSMYRERAQPALEEVKTLFLEVHLDLADAARQQGRCEEARAEAEKIQQVDPENAQAKTIVTKCRPRGPARVAAAPATAAQATTIAPVAAAPAAAAHPAPAAPAAAPRPPAARPAAVRPARPAAVARAPGAAPAAETPSVADEWQPDAADLVKQAREAWMHQQCGSAIELSRRALKIKPNTSDAHQIIAVCACSMKDKDGALKAYAKLDERSRSMVRTLCARNGIELAE